jgi:hypothetical protein
MRISSSLSFDRAIKWLNISRMLGFFKNTSPNYSDRVTKPFKVFLRTMYSGSDNNLNRWLNPFEKQVSTYYLSSNWLRQPNRRALACLSPGLLLWIILDTPSVTFSAISLLPHSTKVPKVFTADSLSYGKSISFLFIIRMHAITSGSTTSWAIWRIFCRV